MLGPTEGPTRPAPSRRNSTVYSPLQQRHSLGRRDEHRRRWQHPFGPGQRLSPGAAAAAALLGHLRPTGLPSPPSLQDLPRKHSGCRPHGHPCSCAGGTVNPMTSRPGLFPSGAAAATAWGAQLGSRAVLVRGQEAGRAPTWQGHLAPTKVPAVTKRRREREEEPAGGGLAQEAGRGT